MSTLRLLLALCCAVSIAQTLRAEEFWLCDDSYLYGFVTGIDDNQALSIHLASGETRAVPLEEIVAIRFRGRTPTLIQTGTQEFRFLSGGALRAEILGQEGNNLALHSHLVGEVRIGLDHFKGFVSLPMEGFSGRKAEELVEAETYGYNRNLDWALHRNGSTYPGVLRNFSRTELTLDHEDFQMPVVIKAHDLAGARLANATRKQEPPAGHHVRVRVRGRDGSALTGELAGVNLGRWSLRPDWDPQRLLIFEADELTQLQVLSGRVQYLSQLEPSAVKESTILSPPQRFRIDASCQNEALSIAGRTFPWGLGVHADSELSYKIGGQFKQFKATIGIATGMGRRGSVVFQVLGDGKERYKSPVLKGSDGKAVEVEVSVEGVQELTLKVTDAGDLDLGDEANWAAARLTR